MIDLRKTTLFIALGIAALGVNSVNACSIQPQEPPFTYEDYIEELRKPKFANLVKRATTADLAIVRFANKTKTPESWYEYDSSDSEPVYKTVYTFQSLENLKGEPDSEFIYKSQFGKSDYQPMPFYKNNENIFPTDNGPRLITDAYADEKHRFDMFWEDGETQIGREITVGDCRTYISFDIGKTYLVLRNNAGEFLSAERIEYDDDIWLIAVRNMIDEPLLGRGYAMDLKNYTRMQHLPSLIEVKNCVKPTIQITTLPEGDAQLQEQEYVPFGKEKYRFAYYPFDGKSCRIGARFYGNFAEFGEWFKIDNSDNVDLTDIGSQLAIKDPREVSLEELKSWISAAAKTDAE